MFSDEDDYVESTGYESYGEPGYSSPFSHWLEDDDDDDDEDIDSSEHHRFFSD